MKKTYMKPVACITDVRMQNGILTGSLDIDAGKSGSDMDSRELGWEFENFDEEQGW